MNDEIKEILDRLERIDHKEYSCGFEFAENSTFDKISRCFEERKKMANYITNLREEKDKEIERLNNVIDEIKKAILTTYPCMNAYDSDFKTELLYILEKRKELKGSDKDEI